MERAKNTLASIFLLFFLLLAWRTEGQRGSLPPGINIAPRPVCISQYSLANYACSRIPYSPLPPPAPTTPSLEEHHHRDSDHDRDRDQDRREGHGHHHHHHHHHYNQGTAEEEDCCRWLSQLDTDCVCDMLVHLPDFLSRPVHRYTLLIGQSCNVSFTCGGRVIRK